MIRSRYHELASKIEKGIQQKRWQERLPGLYKLAEELNANPRTLAKAIKLLEEKGVCIVHGTKGTFISGISTGKKHRVIGIIRNLSANDNDLEFSYLAAEADQQGYAAVTIGIDAKSNAGIPDLTRFPVDGYIFTNSLFRRSFALILRQNGIPFVSVNRISDMPGIPWIDFDNEQGLHDCINNLHLQGAKKIWLAGFYPLLKEHRERLIAVFQQSPFAEPLNIMWTESVAEYRQHWGAQFKKICGQNLAAKIRHKSVNCDGIIVLDTRVAQSFYDALPSGHSIKKNKTIIAFDTYHDSHPAQLDMPVYLFPFKTRCRKAVKLLCELIIQTSAEPIAQELLPGKLQISAKKDKQQKQRSSFPKTVRRSL